MISRPVLRSRIKRAETGPAIGEIDMNEPHIGLRIFAIGEDAAVFDAPDKLLHDRVIEAHHRKSIEGQIFDEVQESVLDRIESFEVIEMFWIDVGDDGDIDRQLEKSAIALSASTTIHSPAPSRALVP